jgi:hypothetical protein
VSLGAAFFVCVGARAQGVEYVLACNSVASGADCASSAAFWSPAPVSWLPGLSVSDALLIAGASILLWSIAWCVRIVRRFLESS